MGYLENNSILNEVANGNTIAWMKDKELDEEEDCDCNGDCGGDCDECRLILIEGAEAMEDR